MTHVLKHVSKLSQGGVCLFEKLPTLSVVACELLNHVESLNCLVLQALCLCLVVSRFHLRNSSLVLHEFNLMLLGRDLIFNVLKGSPEPL